MGAPGFYQLRMAQRLFGKPATQFGHGGQQILLDGPGGGQMHGGGEAVVGALRAVDMVVGVHRALAAALAAGDLVGASGDDLVHVHVALRTAAGLPDHQRELVVVLASQHFVSGLFDESRHIRR